MQTRTEVKKRLAPLIGAPFLLAALLLGLYREAFVTPTPPAEDTAPAIDTVALAGSFND